jgi:hypothetical protein
MKENLKNGLFSKYSERVREELAALFDEAFQLAALNPDRDLKRLQTSGSTVNDKEKAKKAV